MSAAPARRPTVLALTKLLRDLGETPVVLSRGYGGRLRGPVMVDPARHQADDVGDEPLMLARTVPVVGRARSHRRRRLGEVAGRDRDPDGRWFSESRDRQGRLADRDRRRPRPRQWPACSRPVRCARRCRRSLTAPTRWSSSAMEPRPHAVAAAIAARDKPVLSAHLSADDASVESLRGKRVLAFAGIGDPARFFRTLRASGVEVVRSARFADHHPFSEDEIADLIAEAKRDGLTLVTTEKDLVAAAAGRRSGGGRHRAVRGDAGIR